MALPTPLLLTLLRPWAVGPLREIKSHRTLTCYGSYRELPLSPSVPSPHGGQRSGRQDAVGLALVGPEPGTRWGGEGGGACHSQGTPQLGLPLCSGLVETWGSHLCTGAPIPGCGCWSPHHGWWPWPWPGSQSSCHPSRSQSTGAGRATAGQRCMEGPGQAEASGEPTGDQPRRGVADGAGGGAGALGWSQLTGSLRCWGHVHRHTLVPGFSFY